MLGFVIGGIVVLIAVIYVAHRWPTWFGNSVDVASKDVNAAINDVKNKDAANTTPSA